MNLPNLQLLTSFGTENVAGDLSQHLDGVTEDEVLYASARVVQRLLWPLNIIRRESCWKLP